MRWLLTISLLLGVVAGHVSGLAQDSLPTNQLPDSLLLQQMQEWCLQRDTLHLRPELDSLLQRYPRDARLHTLRAYLLICRGGMENRFRAREILEQIHPSAKNNLFYHFVWAELYRAQGFTGIAKRRYEKVLEMNPDFVPALVALGRIHLQEMLRYYYRYTDTEIPLSFREYAIDDYDMAVNYLRHALQLDSTNQEAPVLLGNLYYEAEDYQKMVDLFRKMVKRYPDSRDFNLYLGLAYHALRDYGYARRYFNRALELMPEEERQLFLNPALLNPTSKNPPALPDTTERFWKKKDPLFLTLENERLLEHISRVAYAQMRFSVPALHIPGWQTDRGRTYIRYGRPLYIVEYGKSMEWSAIYPPQQIWVYPDFQLSFSDEFWNGEFRFTQPMPQSKSVFKERTLVDYNLVARDVFATLPDRFDFQRSGGKLTAQYGMYAFRDSLGSYLWVPFRIFIEDENSPEPWYFRAGLFFTDSTGVPFYSVQDSFVIPFPLPRSWREGHYYFQALPRVAVPEQAKGKQPLHYSFELLNTTRDASFCQRDTLTAPTFTEDALVISDIVVARHVEPASEPGALVRHQMRIFPALDGQFSRADTLFIYFEVYHLAPDARGEFHYQVENRLAKVPSKGLLGWLRRRQHRIAVVNEYDARRPNDFVIQSFNLANLPAGKYTLEIVVRDPIAGATCRRRTRIFLFNALTN